DTPARRSRAPARATATTSPTHGTGIDEQALAIELQLVDRFENIVEGAVAGALGEIGAGAGIPVIGQFLDGADVAVAVVQVGLEPGHVTVQETAVLADGVAAQGRGVLPDVALDEVQRLAFGLGLVDGGRPHPVHKTAFAMGPRVPLVHGRQKVVRLVDRDYRPLFEDVELHVGDQGGDLDDAITIRVESGHFEVDPDQAIGVGRHWVSWCNGKRQSYHAPVAGPDALRPGGQ